MKILKVENLSKEYGSGDHKVLALDAVDFAVERGEFVAIVGPSGSGKPKLLHLIGGVDSPTSGQVLVDGKDIASYSSKKRALFRRRKVGLIYQFYNLIPNLSVRHNIELPLTLDKKKVDKDFFHEIVDKLELEAKLDSFPSQLSGGQQQRVAIARSLIYRPAIILADEPTGNLDRKNSQKIMDIFRYFNRSLKQTILLITHDVFFTVVFYYEYAYLKTNEARVLSDSYYEARLDSPISKSDAEKIRKIPGIKNLGRLSTRPEAAKVGDDIVALHFQDEGINEMRKFAPLMEGRFAQAEDEIVLSKSLVEKQGLKLGDRLEMVHGQRLLDGSAIEADGSLSLKETFQEIESQSYKLVGIYEDVYSVYRKIHYGLGLKRDDDPAMTVLQFESFKDAYENKEAIEKEIEEALRHDVDLRFSAKLARYYRLDEPLWAKISPFVTNAAVIVFSMLLFIFFVKNIFWVWGLQKIREISV